MSFDVGADAYGRFMGRYSEPLAKQFAAFAGVDQGQRAVDVGCGTGALTAELVARLGSGSVSAIDPSSSFVAAMHSRFPDLDVRAGSAEALPFEDDAFDVAVAQLVVHFMSDPVLGLSEMARVTRSGGVVAACVWDHAGGVGPLSLFWHAVRDLDSEASDESQLAGAREGHLAELFALAGVQQVQTRTLTVHVHYATFDEWWEPFTLGVGPAGGYVAQLDDRQRADLQARCAMLLPDAPFEIAASAWSVSGRA